MCSSVMISVVPTRDFHPLFPFTRCATEINFHPRCFALWFRSLADFTNLYISTTCRFHPLVDLSYLQISSTSSCLVDWSRDNTHQEHNNNQSHCTLLFPHHQFLPISCLRHRFLLSFQMCDTRTRSLSLTHTHTHAHIHKCVKNCCRWARRGRGRTTITRETFWNLFYKIP